MKYYKIIVSNTFIGVINSRAFLVENPHTHRLQVSTDTEGQFVDYAGELYRDYWMRPISSERQFIQALIEEITENEYLAIIEAIENDEEIIIDDDDNEDEPIVIPDVEDPDVVLEFMRESKINEMNHICRTTIEAGFDLVLRGETRHFSLTTQDQLNLMSLSAMAQTQSLIPYHADGEEVTFYTSEEINQIVNAANTLKIYNTTYCNALKAYVNTLETIEEIGSIEYGTPIPDEYKTEVLKVLEG